MPSNRNQHNSTKINKIDFTILIEVIKKGKGNNRDYISNFYATVAWNPSVPEVPAIVSCFVPSKEDPLYCASTSITIG
jgi:hypothetical protein